MLKEKLTELKIQKQIEYVDTLITGLKDWGHDINVTTIDVLDELAIFGLELTPIKDENIPSLAYVYLMKKRMKKDKK